MSYKQKLSNITTFVFDVDGVLTDGSIILHSDGEMIRTMHTKDGYALQHAIKKGFNIIIITGGSSTMVKKRLEGLGIKNVFLAAHQKLPILEEYLSNNKINPDEVLYMGDDIPDYRCLKFSGISTCPKDACVEIREICDYISHINGGKGAVRDVIEQTLRVQGKWMDEDAHSW
tara:strand:+ start:175 stop:693 length:519 start_codon:yes stop_codon:yes gene_type:complete